MINIMIVDDIQECAEYYAAFIGKESDMKILGIANSSTEAIEMAATCTPDIVLMDVQLEHEKAGIEATERILESNSNIKIIILSAYDDSDLIIDAFFAGAVDYLVKMSPMEQVLGKIRKVYSQDEFLGPKIVQNVKEEMVYMRKQRQSLLFMINYISTLTKREKNILRNLMKNKSRVEIMELEHIEETTLKTHIQNILRKLEYRNVKEMVRELTKLNISTFLNDI